MKIFFLWKCFPKSETSIEWVSKKSFILFWEASSILQKLKIDEWPQTYRRTLQCAHKGYAGSFLFFFIYFALWKLLPCIMYFIWTTSDNFWTLSDFFNNIWPFLAANLQKDIAMCSLKMCRIILFFLILIESILEFIWKTSNTFKHFWSLLTTIACR